MGYATVRIDKIKTSKEMNSRYKHNYREYDVANADGNLSHLNREIKGLNGRTYEEVAQTTLNWMKVYGYCGKAVRKDAVRGFEILLSYSHEDKDKVPVDKWIEKSVAWLEENFNPKDHKIVITDENGNKNEVKSDNVKSIVVHFDEAVPHIHAFVVPIDEKGALNAKRYTGTRAQLQQYQTSYAKEMEEFGLRRGTKGQKSHHENVAKFYTELNKAVSAELPEIKEGETIQEYRERANEEFQREKIHHRNDLLKAQQEVKEARADKINLAAEHYLKEDKLGKQIVKLAREMEVPELNDRDVLDIRRRVQRTKDIDDMVEKYPDKEVSERFMNDYNTMMTWLRENEKKKKKSRRPDGEIEKPDEKS